MSTASHQPANLSGRTVLVTGGNGGIGLAMARAVGQAGASVIIWGRQPDKTDQAIEQLRAEGITSTRFPTASPSPSSSPTVVSTR